MIKVFFPKAAKVGVDKRVTFRLFIYMIGNCTAISKQYEKMSTESAEFLLRNCTLEHIILNQSYDLVTKLKNA